MKEQAQTIDNIKRAHRIAKLKLSSQGVEPLGIAAHLDRGALLEIVDSQAQKIAQLTKERDAMTATAYRLVVDEQQHIIEARAEAEKWRQATIGYKYGNQWTQEGFALNESEKLPWEKR